MITPHSNLSPDDEHKEVIAIAVHELRTSLSSLKWLYAMLTDGDYGTLNTEQVDVIRKANGQNERMLSVVNALLTLIKNDAPGISFSLSRIDIRSPVLEVIDEFSAERTKRQITLHTTIPPEAIECDTDHDKMRIIYENIMSNAMKYSPDGSTIELVLSTEDGNGICTVEDHGIGVPPDDQKNIFQKFFRARNAQVQSAIGTGLGLYTTKRLLDQLGGAITFSETAGGGATFAVGIPLHQDKGRF